MSAVSKWIAIKDIPIAALPLEESKGKAIAKSPEGDLHPMLPPDLEDYFLFKAPFSYYFLQLYDPRKIVRVLSQLEVMFKGFLEAQEASPDVKVAVKVLRSVDRFLEIPIPTIPGIVAIAVEYEQKYGIRLEVVYEFEGLQEAVEMVLREKTTEPVGVILIPDGAIHTVPFLLKYDPASDSVYVINCDSLGDMVIDRSDPFGSDTQVIRDALLRHQKPNWCLMFLVDYRQKTQCGCSIDAIKFLVDFILWIKEVEASGKEFVFEEELKAGYEPIFFSEKEGVLTFKIPARLSKTAQVDEACSRGRAEGTVVSYRKGVRHEVPIAAFLEKYKVVIQQDVVVESSSKPQFPGGKESFSAYFPGYVLYKSWKMTATVCRFLARHEDDPVRVRYRNMLKEIPDV